MVWSWWCHPLTFNLQKFPSICKMLFSLPYSMTLCSFMFPNLSTFHFFCLTYLSNHLTLTLFHGRYPSDSSWWYEAPLALPFLWRTQTPLHFLPNSQQGQKSLTLHFSIVTHSSSTPVSCWITSLYWYVSFSTQNSGHLQKISLESKSWELSLRTSFVSPSLYNFRSVSFKL